MINVVNVKVLSMQDEIHTHITYITFFQKCFIIPQINILAK